MMARIVRNDRDGTAVAENPDGTNRDWKFTLVDGSDSGFNYYWKMPVEYWSEEDARKAREYFKDITRLANEAADALERLFKLLERLKTTKELPTSISMSDIGRFPFQSGGSKYE